MLKLSREAQRSIPWWRFRKRAEVRRWIANVEARLLTADIRAKLNAEWAEWWFLMPTAPEWEEAHRMGQVMLSRMTGRWPPPGRYATLPPLGPER